MARNANEKEFQTSKMAAKILRNARKTGQLGHFIIC
jgi:hypothetical protein